MKELLVKKRTELVEICRRSHMEVPSLSEMDHVVSSIKHGEMDYAVLLRSMDEQIARAEDEALSRKMIMEKVEKWALAREEERWLEEYNMDENRYTVSRGAHKNLKRAERARVMVNKIPALVESLIAKTKSWEEERKKVFLYDEVPLLALMQEYNMSMDEQIARAEDEALSRKMIMEKVEKWALAREEERWLEEYNMDENRYTVSRGAHKNLKRAERARVMVNKIPALVESLIAKTKSWEEERKKVFLYDEVPLLALMQEYNMSRHEKEEDKQRRQREKKLAQSKVVVLHESVMLTRPTTSSRRLDQSVNGGFKRVPTGVQFGTSNVKLPNPNIPCVNDGKGSQGPKKLPPSRFDRCLKEDRASYISRILRSYLRDLCGMQGTLVKARLELPGVLCAGHTEQGVKLTDKSFWEVERAISDSWGWKNMLDIRDKIKPFVPYKIGDGKSIFAWHDK
nr:65-kDa microtubule-associated protein 8 isoform X1 [Tanacetum cinerariifolium]